MNRCAEESHGTRKGAVSCQDALFIICYKACTLIFPIFVISCLAIGDAKKKAMIERVLCRACPNAAQKGNIVYVKQAGQ